MALLIVSVESWSGDQSWSGDHRFSWHSLSSTAGVCEWLSIRIQIVWMPNTDCNLSTIVEITGLNKTSNVTGKEGKDNLCCKVSSHQGFSAGHCDTGQHAGLSVERTRVLLSPSTAVLKLRQFHSPHFACIFPKRH